MPFRKKKISRRESRKRWEAYWNFHDAVKAGKTNLNPLNIRRK